MAQSKTQTVEDYLKALPEYRREIISEMRDLILDHIPDGYRETISWGMINYEIPLEKYPDTYNDQPLSYIGLAAQENHNALYLMSVYQDEELSDWMKEQFEQAGKRLDMGRSCIRFQTINDLPLDAITDIIGHQTPDEFIEAYEESRK